MKLEFNENDYKNLERLIEIKDNNIAFSNMLNYFFDNIGYFYTSDIELYKKETGLSTNEAIYYLMMESLDIDLSNNLNKKLCNEYILKNLRESKINKYLDNEYYKNVRPKIKTSGKYQLTYSHFEKYQVFPDNEIILKNEFKEYTPICYFKEKFEFLTLMENDVIWMAITPNEINTMEYYIKKMEGKVVIFGLGLGYITYMLSLKDEINHVVVIENNKQIIDIFRQNILPFFSDKQKKKIEIKYMDAFVFLKEQMKNDYKYAFFDLWHNPNDGLPLYLKIIKYEKTFKKCEFFYWLEESIIALARRCLLTLFKEATLNYKKNKYLKEQIFTDKVINRSYFILENKTFTNFNELLDFLKFENIKSFLKKF